MAPHLVEKDIVSLIKLFSDEDPSVIRLLEESFRTQGPSSIPFLRQIASEAPRPARENVEQLLLTLLKDLAIQKFNEFCLHGADMETGLFLLAQTRYFDMDPEPYRSQIQGMCQTLRSRTLPNEPRKTVDAVNDYLFMELGFKGNTDHFYDTENSFINRVLDRRKGIPITLSALYLLITKPLGLPLVGVGMPGHFILKWNQGSTMNDRFFVDPFHEGRILTQNDCVDFLVQNGYRFSPNYLEPVSSRQILARMCNNLAGIYGHQDEAERAEQYAKFARSLSL